jgi:hypothetical protein
VLDDIVAVPQLVGVVDVGAAAAPAALETVRIGPDVVNDVLVAVAKYKFTALRIESKSDIL